MSMAWFCIVVNIWPSRPENHLQAAFPVTPCQVSQSRAPNSLQLWNAYIGEAMQEEAWYEDEEHWDACQRGLMEEPAVAEHVCL